MFRKPLMGLGLLSIFLIFPLFLSAEFLILGPSDFICEVNDPAVADYYCDQNYIRPSIGDIYRYYYAHLHLPEGVRIREVTLYYLDDSTGYIELKLLKHRMYDHVNVSSFSHITSGAANFARTDVIPGSSISTKLIKNQSNRYVMYLYFSSGDVNLRVYGVKIKYY